MSRRSALALATVFALVATLSATPADAATTPGATTAGSTPSSTASAAVPVVVVAAGPDPALGVSFEVQDFAATSEGFGFAEASLDGAVVDTGDRDFRLSSDVLFAFDKATLTARAGREITRIAGKLKATAGSTSVARVRVTGYTDAVGADGYNLRLSRRRAEAVRKKLAAELGPGVTVTATGRGEAAPIASNDTSTGRKANRRVEIRG